MSKQTEKNALYNAISHSIVVSVKPSFIEDESSIEENRYIWMYQICIENQGEQILKLRRRYWKIINCYGKIFEITGEGVVGEQPTLKPGERFEYISAAPLNSPSGIMEGYYLMTNEKEEEFKIKIPAFSLDSPYQKQTLN